MTVAELIAKLKEIRPESPGRLGDRRGGDRVLFVRLTADKMEVVLSKR
jgi:hypothetical protein